MSESAKTFFDRLRMWETLTFNHEETNKIKKKPFICVAAVGAAVMKPFHV